MKNPFAYPVPDTPTHSERGMTLRDYFAGQALAGNCQKHRTAEDEAQIAYEIADAMLLEREKAK